MQNRYVGDIGDFFKLAILRALMPDKKLGVAWWLHPDQSHNDDGRHTGYLQHPDAWRFLDPALFDKLYAIVKSEVRAVSALEQSALLPGAVYAHAMIPLDGTSKERRVSRSAWFEGVRQTLKACDLVFVDPDNGLETTRYSAGSKAAAKSIALDELSALAVPGRTLIVYHHHTRRKGGHIEELNYWMERLQGLGHGSVTALRAPRFSPRAFFIINASESLSAKAKQLAENFPRLLTWHSGANF